MESLSWQLPAYITIGVIGGGMAVGLLVICVICGFCSIFNRKYDNEEREKRKVSLQAIAIKTDKRPVDRLYCTPSSRSILLSNSPGKPLRSDNGPIFPTGDDQKEQKKGSQYVTATGANCQHCSGGLPVEVMRTNQGGTITSVLRHACACTLFMSTSPSDRSITGDELRQLASSSTETIHATTSLASNIQADSSRHHWQLSPLLTRDTDPLIVISDSTSTETIARTRKILTVRSHFNQLDPSSISSCCVSPQDELQHFTLPEESQHNIGRVAAPSRPVHVHPLLHPHFHTHSKDDLPIEGDVLLESCQTDVHMTENTPQNLELPSDCLTVMSQAVSPMSDYDSTEIENAGKASWDGHANSADPCKALWDLRSVLEHRTGVKPEPVIRLIGESDTEMDIMLDESGQPVVPDANQLQAPGSILTSLTSFESNTPSEESFDATSCARALEAIFDEPSDLPTLSTVAIDGNSDGTTTRSLSISATSAAIPLYSSSTHLTPPVHRQQRKPSPPKLTSHQKRQSFKKAHHLAAKTTTHTTTTVVLQVVTIDEVNPAKSSPPAPAAETKAITRSPLPHRLQQMKNDSGYKSQSLDHAASATPLIHIQTYKSVPHLPSELVSEEPAPPRHLQTDLDLTENSQVYRYEVSSLEAPNATFFLSASSDADMEDVSSLASSCVPSLTSSMEIDTVCARIPLLLTHPATPTTPPRDWTIDERSDRLFREFNRPETANVRSNSLRATTGSSRQHRPPLLPKRKSYSPSSSHTGTPAQASIEETEEEEEHILSSGVPAVAVGQGDVLTRHRSLTPDFFVCSTKEQLLNHINMRSQSPELRNVPIIKLPDQESDEV